MHPLVDRLAAYSWRLLVIAAAGVAALWLVGRMWVVFLPLVVALFLTRALAAPARHLRTHRWRRGLAAAAVLGAFLAALVGASVLVGVAVRGQIDDIGPTVSRAVDDIETWLVEDAPIDIDRSDIGEFRADASEAIRSSGGSLVSGAVLAVEVVLSLVLGLIVTFFALKDGDRFLRWVQGLVPAGRRELAGRLAGRAWGTVGGYLRGAALLGLVEGTVLAATLAVVGAELAVPVGVFTFLMAFLPFVGAIVASALAVLVTLATAGGTAALIVLAVAIVVQQVDNDVLAPVVYGRSLAIHPVLVLLAIAGGGALFGLAGSLLAVPVAAVVVNVAKEARSATVGQGAGTEGAAGAEA